MSDIQTLMRSANPIEDARTEFGQDDLDALLLLTQRRSGDMDVKEVTTPVTPEKRNNRGWLVTAVAFAGVIAVAALAVMLSRPADDVEPAAPTTTLDTAPPTTAGPTSTVVDTPGVSPEDQAVLDAYVAAMTDGDVDELRSILDPGIRRLNDRGYPRQVDLDGLLLEAQVRHARGSSTILEGCRPAGDRIQCSMLYEGPVDRALYSFQLRDSYWFTINGDQIVGMEAKCAVCTPGAESEDRIRSWVREFDPVAATEMAVQPDEALSIAGGVAWLHYAPMWREAETDGRLAEVGDAMAAIKTYEETWNAGDVDGFASLLTADAQRVELVNEIELASDRDTMVAEMAAYVAQGASIDVHSCTLADESIQCTITTRSPVVEALVFRSKTDTATFTVVDGVITRLGWVCRDCLIGMDTEADLVRWMRSQYPDEAETLGTTVVGLRDAVVAARWAEIAQEWIDAGRP